MTANYQSELAATDIDEKRLPDPKTPEGEALRWWVTRVNERNYVGLKTDLPGTSATKVLLLRDLIATTPSKWGFVVKSPHSDSGQAILRNTWALVSAAFRLYSNSALDRITAIRLLTGNEAIPEIIYCRSGNVRNIRKLELLDGYHILLQPDSQIPSETDLTSIALGDSPPVNLPLVSEANLLINLPLGDVRDNLDTIAIWLRTLSVSRSALVDAYTQNPRPVLLKRMGDLARKAANHRLADMIEEVIITNVRSGISRTHTGVGSEFKIPSYITAQPPAITPWLERHRVQMEQAIAILDPLLSERESKISLLSADEVIRTAKENKKFDTYHSTTIEGYRITPEEVRAVIEGRSYSGQSPEETERFMALKGYSNAFDWTLQHIIENKNQYEAPQINEALVLDIFLELWSPSVEAKVVDFQALRRWRTQAVHIRGSLHVPPAHEKLSALMTQFVNQLNASKVGPVTRAVLAHWQFVNLHPFKDGNGRISRLLMNYILSAAGFPWTTIRADERAEYFNSLELAHVKSDFTPLGMFIMRAVERASLPDAAAPAIE